MLQRIVESVLIAAIALSLWRLVDMSRDRYWLLNEADLLEARVGRAEVADKKRSWVKLVHHEPGHYAWHIYLPSTNSFDFCMGHDVRGPGRSYLIGNGMRSTGDLGGHHLIEVGWDLSGPQPRFAFRGVGSHGVRTGTQNTNYLIWKYIEQCDVKLLGQDGDQSIDGRELIRLMEVRVPLALREQWVHENLVRKSEALMFEQPWVLYIGSHEVIEEFRTSTAPRRTEAESDEKTAKP